MDRGKERERLHIMKKGTPLVCLAYPTYTINSQYNLITIYIALNMQKGISLFFIPFHPVPKQTVAKYHIKDGKICSINKEESIPLTDEHKRDISVYRESNKQKRKEKLKAILGRQFY